MRKLYNHNKHKIHPSPPPTAAAPTDHLSLLPIAIATLAAALAPEDKEVLAYLLSCSLIITTATKNFSGDSKPTNKIVVGDGGGRGNHPPQFNCNCFTCYTSYWVRWDASPNRQLIHEIIDAYEDELIQNQKNGKNKREKKKNKASTPTPPSSSSRIPHAPPTASAKVSHAPPKDEEIMMINNSDEDVGQDDLTMESSSSSEKGPVRKFVSFIGGRIWGVWGV